MFEGLYGMPIDLPGTALRKALQARDRLRTLLWPEIEGDVTAIVEQARARRLLRTARPPLLAAGPPLIVSPSVTSLPRRLSTRRSTPPAPSRWRRATGRWA